VTPGTQRRTPLLLLLFDVPTLTTMALMGCSSPAMANPDRYHPRDRKQVGELPWDLDETRYPSGA